MALAAPTITNRTWVSVTYEYGFFVCRVVPCLTPEVPVLVANRIACKVDRSAWAELAWPPGQQERLGRVDNLADRHVAGSVIVDGANKRFFEPAAEHNFRAARAGVSASILERQVPPRELKAANAYAWPGSRGVDAR